MANFTNPLERVKVSAPCRADWDAMIGDERTRFCHHCERNVYNLSGMSKREAEALVTNAEGRLCVRFYRRADGTILTDNCPVGLRAVRQRVARVLRATVSAALGFFAGLGLAPAPSHFEIMGAMAFDPEPLEVVEPRPEVVGQIAAPVSPPPQVWEVGKMAPVQINERSGASRARGTRARRQK